jgi:hypothetical protein
VTGNGSRAEDVLRLVDRYRPDVVVLADRSTRRRRRTGGPRGDGGVAVCGAPVVARAVDAGVLGFLTKPVRAEELGPTLHGALHRFREVEAIRKERAAQAQARVAQAGGPGERPPGQALAAETAGTPAGLPIA